MEELNQIKELLKKMTSADIELVIQIATKKLKEQVVRETINQSMIANQSKENDKTNTI